MRTRDPMREPAASGATQHLFFRTPEQRIVLARQRFFEEGIRPTGAIGEPVIQSWMRCLAAHHEPQWQPQFQPVTPSRTHTALARARELLEVAREELGSLEASLAGTDCRVLLTDPHGVVVHVTQAPSAEQPILKTVRVGTNVAEEAVGTTAPGVVARTGHAVSVVGAEHFYDCLSSFECAAAPIRDANGELAGVLDLSVEGGRFGFHGASVVGLYATLIENRLMQHQARDQLVLCFQADRGLLRGPLVAMAGVDESGGVRWLNSVAVCLLGLGRDAIQQPAQAVFGLGVQQLLALTREESPRFARLPSGLGVWLQARLRQGDGADFNHGVAVQPLRRAPAAEIVPSSQPQEPAQLEQASPAGTLQNQSRELIEAALAACAGNISRAARKLGVSRGLLYRRLQAGDVARPAGRKVCRDGTEPA